MPQFGTKYDVISKKQNKKGLHRNLKVFSGQKQVMSKQKSLRASHADFSVSFRCAPFQAYGPSAGLPEANEAPQKHMVPLKSMGPEVIVPPCPPLGGPVR